MNKKGGLNIRAHPGTAVSDTAAAINSTMRRDAKKTKSVILVPARLYLINL